jgi:hypothetical protein
MHPLAWMEGTFSYMPTSQPLLASFFGLRFVSLLLNHRTSISTASTRTAGVSVAIILESPLQTSTQTGKKSHCLALYDRKKQWKLC